MPAALSLKTLQSSNLSDSLSLSSPYSRKKQRDRLDRRRRLVILPRQNVVADQPAVAAAKYNCEVYSGNAILSCYPNSSTTIYQDQFATFVWNSRLPQYAQLESVNVYLFHGDTNQQILQWINQTNPINRAGYLSAPVNDSWWGSRGSVWNGTNIPYLYYWVVTPNTQVLGNSYVPQSTFTAVQTTYADSVLATMTSPSSASSATSSVNPTASGSQSSVALSGTVPPTRTGSVQTGIASPPFPHWAIAVIVVLGFLAILATCVLTFVMIRRSRRRREGANLSHRGSVGSSTPMMAETLANAAPSSPVLGGAAALAPSSSGHHDGASIISRANSAGDSALFSGADAAIMADAFREALRKPKFAEGGVDEETQEEKQRKDAELLNRELAEEGRDIRSVPSSKGVRVETLDDEGGTVQDIAH